MPESALNELKCTTHLVLPMCLGSRNYYDPQNYIDERRKDGKEEGVKQVI